MSSPTVGGSGGSLRCTIEIGKGEVVNQCIRSHNLNQHTISEYK